MILSILILPIDIFFIQLTIISYKHYLSIFLSLLFLHSYITVLVKRKRRG